MYCTNTMFSMAKHSARPRHPARSWARPLKLREWRDYREMTGEELAAEAGVSQGLVSQIESGQSNGSPASLQKLSTALNCTVPELFNNPMPGHRRLEISVPEADYDRVLAIIRAAIKR